MKKNEVQAPEALDHVDPKRRGFLAKMLAGTVALPVMSTVALGQTPQEGKAKGKGGKGKGGKGKGGAAGKGKGQAAGKGRTAGGDPAALAKRMISEFDKDGDAALNEAELTAALTAARERRAAMQDGAAPPSRGDAAGKGKGKGKGNGKGKGGAGKGQPAAGGGVVPRRPGT